MEINKTFVDDEYINLAETKKFLKENNLPICSFKLEGIQNISEFGVYDEEKVLKWIDKTIKQGIKYCYIAKIKDGLYKFKDINLCQKFIEEYFKDRSAEYQNNAQFESKLKINKIDYTEENGRIENVNINIGLLVYERRKKENEYVYEKIKYPIFADMDLINNVLEIRIKSKAQIYEIDNSGVKESSGKNISVDNMASEVLKFLEYNLGIDVDVNPLNKTEYYKAYYKILESMTKTPQEIVNIIDNNKEQLVIFAEEYFNKLGLDKKYFKMSVEDMAIWLEKYLSLSIKDKNIFIEENDGYPIQLTATDSDDTRVEETSAKREPLQTKPSFFDHKKIFMREKSCDGLTLAFNRINKLYYGNDPYAVKMFFKKGFGVINFPEYVEEGDIQNVLSRVKRHL